MSNYLNMSFEERMKIISDEELLKILKLRNEYQPEAAKAAINEAIERNLITSNDDLNSEIFSKSNNLTVQSLSKRLQKKLELKSDIKTLNFNSKIIKRIGNILIGFTILFMLLITYAWVTGNNGPYYLGDNWYIIILGPGGFFVFYYIVKTRKIIISVCYVKVFTAILLKFTGYALLINGLFFSILGFAQFFNNLISTLVFLPFLFYGIGLIYYELLTDKLIFKNIKGIWYRLELKILLIFIIIGILAFLLGNYL